MGRPLGSKNKKLQSGAGSSVKRTPIPLREVVMEPITSDPRFAGYQVCSYLEYIRGQDRWAAVVYAKGADALETHRRIEGTYTILGKTRAEVVAESVRRLAGVWNRVSSELHVGDAVSVTSAIIPDRMPLPHAYVGCKGTVVDFYENSPKVLVDLKIGGGVSRVPIASYYLERVDVAPVAQ